MKAFVFDCRGVGVAPIFVVHAKCLDIAVREARHRFQKVWGDDDEHPGALIDLSSAREEPAENYWMT